MRGMFLEWKKAFNKALLPQFVAFMFQFGNVLEWVQLDKM